METTANRHEAIEGERRTFEVSMSAPDPAWHVGVETIHRAGEELWVLCRVSRDPEVMAPQVITTVSDRVETPAPDLPAVYFIAGKTWSWGDGELPEHYRILEDETVFARMLEEKEAELLFER